MDVVWRSSARKELAGACKLSFASIMWDLHKCYEMIRHDILARAALKHLFPLAILRITLESYRKPRTIIMHSITSRPLLPSRGIIAGSAMATAELRLVLLDVASYHVTKNPDVNLSIYLDDITLDYTGNDRGDVLEHIIPAALDLAACVESISCLPISRSKSAIISNDFILTRSIRGALGDLGGPELGSVRALGVDIWNGIKAPKGALKTRRKRYDDVAKRRHRLGCLRGADFKTSGKVYICGILPSILYDAPVLGLTGRKLKSVRAEAARMLGLTNCGKAINVALAFNRDKDPEIIAGAAVVKRLCKEVFVAGLPAGVRDPSVISVERGRGVILEPSDLRAQGVI